MRKKDATSLFCDPSYTLPRDCLSGRLGKRLAPRPQSREPHGVLSQIVFSENYLLVSQLTTTG